MEKLIHFPRGLRTDAWDLPKVHEARALDGFQRAEMAEQRALARRAHARDLLQARLANVLLAARAMRADGEAMRFVAHTLDEIEQRVPWRQLERVPARHEEGLASRLAVGALG